MFYLFACWVISFFFFFVICGFFSKINFFKKIFQEYHQSVKQFGFRSGPTFCQAWSGSKLFVKVISRWQVATSGERVNHEDSLDTLSRWQLDDIFLIFLSVQSASSFCCSHVSLCSLLYFQLQVSSVKLLKDQIRSHLKLISQFPGITLLYDSYFLLFLIYSVLGKQQLANPCILSFLEPKAYDELMWSFAIRCPSRRHP